MGMDGCILLFKVMNRCEVVLLNMRWDLHFAITVLVFNSREAAVGWRG